MSKELIAVAQNWASHDPDLKTKKQVEELIANNNIEKLSELFAGDLEFGTAGLRAEIDAGQSRMNRAVVLRATYGLCQYLLKKYPNKKTEWVTLWYKQSWKDAKGVADSMNVVNDIRMENGKMVQLDEKVSHYQKK